MIIYILVYFFSILFLVGSAKIYKKNKALACLFFIISVLIPCILAALRDISVGTDTKGYISKLYNTASGSDNLIEFFNKADWYYSIKDYGYLFFTYIAAKVFGSFPICLFFIEVLVVVPVFVAILMNKQNNKDIVLGGTIFFLYIYNASYNMARQSIAIAFVILALSLMYRNKNKKAIILLIIASLFHVTAVIAIPVWFLYKYYNKRKDSKKFDVLGCVLIILSIVVVFSIKGILILLHDMKIYEHGIIYVERFSTFDFSFVETGFYIVICLILFLNKNKFLEKNINYKFYLFLSIESIILLQLGTFIKYLDRVGYYYMYPILINAIALIEKPKENNENYESKSVDKSNVKVSKQTIIVYAVFVGYWLYKYVLLNSHNTIPYILG